MDAFALPVKGTETRVNAQEDAYEYMVEYSQTNKHAGRLENVVGWYHSHSGYGCWLSGIDYYALDITYFKSSLDNHLLDILWNKYWVNTLSSSPLLGNGDFIAGQMSDLAEKLEQAENQLAHSRFGPLVTTHRKKEDDSQLAKITRDSAKITVEQVYGLISQVIKDILFNTISQSHNCCSEHSDSEPMVET
ncbi:hypothetical protein SAY86_027252 [Trapa natans]|uniref:MPN domain-containing protein n=1 Tax=Trapa natans TaxID=22666 RepID=A0AAN7KU20_TRANT|nr:hypothetical protein SAY86_027252 [Trapa natans]